MNAANIVLSLAIVTTGLSSGLLFAYQISVIPAFVSLPDATYVAAMQTINDAIQNALFFAAYFSPLVLLPAAAWMARGDWGTPRPALLIAASAIYIVGTIVVTVAANVPLNDALAHVSLHASTPEQVHAARAGFEGPWNGWHLARTIASFVAFTCAVVAGVSRQHQ